jgi:two-component system, sensor histidine kinase and response regulator
LVTAELRELNQLKNRFLGMVAHDLRRTISLIMTYSEFVLDEAGTALSDEHRGFLRTCLAAANDMKSPIDNFLDVSIIESGSVAAA